jgi:hypothetical protein
LETLQLAEHFSRSMFSLKSDDDDVGHGVLATFTVLGLCPVP